MTDEDQDTEEDEISKALPRIGVKLLSRIDKKLDTLTTVAMAILAVLLSLLSRELGWL
jgi:cell division protein FtsL